MFCARSTCRLKKDTFIGFVLNYHVNFTLPVCSDKPFGSLSHFSETFCIERASSSFSNCFSSSPVERAVFGLTLMYVAEVAVAQQL